MSTCFGLAISFRLFQEEMGQEGLEDFYLDALPAVIVSSSQHQSQGRPLLGYLGPMFQRMWALLLPQELLY